MGASSRTLISLIRSINLPFFEGILKKSQIRNKYNNLLSYYDSLFHAHWRSTRLHIYYFSLFSQFYPNQKMSYQTNKMLPRPLLRWTICPNWTFSAAPPGSGSPGSSALSDLCPGTPNSYMTWWRLAWTLPEWIFLMEIINIISRLSWIAEWWELFYFWFWFLTFFKVFKDRACSF